MHNRRKLVKQLMLLLRNLKGEEVKICDIEYVLCNGRISSVKIDIQASRRPPLKIVKPPGKS
jgi:hypothetical protein